jgi:uncharacterized Zn-binding protein involved in type VI secretion
MSTAFSVQRIGDPVICICTCKGNLCPDGFIFTGDPRTWVEGQQVARVGDLASNCCGSCCKCPNAVLSGAARTFPPIARRVDAVTCGLFIGGAVRTFIGG